MSAMRTIGAMEAVEPMGALHGAKVTPVTTATVTPPCL